MADLVTPRHMNEAIAAFEGWQLVSIGYFGSRDGGEDDETDWQVENEAWLEKVDLSEVGRYFVNVQKDEFVEEGDLDYMKDWNHMMRVVIKISEMERGRFGFTIDPFSITIMDYSSGVQEPVLEVNKDIEQELIDVYADAVYNFVQWFSSQPSFKEQPKIVKNGKRT